MAQYVTPAQLTGLFKESYADDILNLIPESAKLTKMIPFVQRDKELGNKYHQPVVLGQEQGVTYAAADAGAFALNDSIAMQLKDAQIQGNQMLLRSSLAYDSAARASNSKKAFVKGTELLVENMLESLTKRLELSILYGQIGLGASSSATAVNATTTDVVLSAASWATGIWAGLENAKFNFYIIASSTLISSGADSIFTLSTVTPSTRTLRFTGTATGNTALVAATATPMAPYFDGSFSAEMAGLQKIIANTGTLFNIDASTYNLWKGNSVTVSGQLTMSKVLSGVAQAVARGLQEKVICAVNPDTWANLASDLAALRRFDGSYSKKKSENGAESLCYYGQNGEIEIMSHIFVKAGDCFIFPPKRAKRIGAQEISFKTPGREDEIFLHLPSNAGFELRLYGDQALFIEKPAVCVYISGFTNS
jgi:hypothetical protein